MVKKEVSSDKAKKKVKSENSTTMEVTFKPYQKKETPPPGVADRVYYESLYKENPNSLMALTWCLNHGVLPVAKCEAALAKIEKLKGKASNGGSSSSRSSGPKAKRAKASRAQTPGDDLYDVPAEFTSSGADGFGTTTM